MMPTQASDGGDRSDADRGHAEACGPPKPAATRLGAWPSDLQADYATAAVRLATVVRDRVQRLVFACVELYPPEIAAPTTVQEYENFGKDTLRFSLTPLEVVDALAWYDELAAGRPVVPGLPQHKLASVSLLPEPAVCRFVVGASVPFEPAWHGGARLHRLVNLVDAEASVGAIVSSEPNSRRWDQARAWLHERLAFDVLASDDWLGGCALLAPNPAIRDLEVRSVPVVTAGAERLRFTATLRTGIDPESLRVRVTERRNGGIAHLSTYRLDKFGTVEVDFPQPTDQLGVQLVHDRLGLIYHQDAGPRIRQVVLNTSVVSGRVGVEVPSPKRGGPVSTYERDVVEDAGSTTIGEMPQVGAQERLRELTGRRDRRTGSMRPGAVAGLDDAFVFDGGNREYAANVIRRLLARAKTSVTFVDPYFDGVSLREFALAVPNRGATIHLLTKYRTKRSEDEEVHPMVGLHDELQGVSELFATSRLGALKARVTGGKVRHYHDRFLIIDDEAWHCGHSFNEVGRGELSVMTRLRRPETLIALVASDYAGAEPFEEAHRRWLASQPAPPSALRRLALENVRRLKRWLERSA